MYVFDDKDAKYELNNKEKQQIINLWCSECQFNAEIQNGRRENKLILGFSSYHGILVAKWVFYFQASQI